MTGKNVELIENVPRHVAIIMDGNGRWAISRGLPRLAGHRAGTENLRAIIEGCIEFGVQYLTIYAFSTENWGRPKAEVNGLMSILEDVIDRELKEMHENGVCLRHIGRLDQLTPMIKKKVLQAIDLTKENTKLVLNVAFNYGGRDEIVSAIQRIVKDGIQPVEITEDLVSRYLFTAGTPDPDLIIRTSGELRGSNFLIWQGTYSEWYFTQTYWPDFNKEELRKALEDYCNRSRRFGRSSTTK